MTPGDVMQWIVEHMPLPLPWLARHPSDEEERRQDREAIQRARDVVDKWDERLQDAWRDDNERRLRHLGDQVDVYQRTTRPEPPDHD